MPPRKRAAADVSLVKDSRGKNKRKRVDKKPSRATPDAGRCYLLELPSELRNRIYDFATERAFTPGVCEPPLLVNTTARVKSLHSRTARNFFGLTQSCRLIRSEYRPLWLRHSAVCIGVDDFIDFIAAFYPRVDQYANAPKLMIIILIHAEDDYEDAFLDITPLLRLRSACPTFEALFGSPRNLACEACGYPCSCSCFRYCGAGGCSCYDDHVNILAYLSWYARWLNEIFANGNPSWLEVLRDDKLVSIKVEYTFNSTGPQLIVYFRFPQDSVAHITAMNLYKGALQYLKSHGFLDLLSRRFMVFVIGVATGRWTRPLGCGDKVQTYNQVEIPGDTKWVPEEES